MRQIVSVFFDENKTMVELWFKDPNYHNFHIFYHNYFKTDSFLNSFQEHLFGIITNTEKIRDVTSKFLFYVKTRLLNMTWSNLRFNVWMSFISMGINLLSCLLIQFLEKLLTFPLNFTLLKYVKSQRGYSFFITKELTLWFPNFGFFFHFAASLISPSAYLS